jgi:putative oxidoreductase
MTTPQSSATFKRVTSWTLQILLAFLFAVQGLVKLMGSPNWIARFNRWGYPHHFYLVVGAAELAGAGLLLVPKSAKFGALLLSVVMIGAAGTHLLHNEPQVMTTLVLLALLGAVFYLRCEASRERVRTE